MAKLQLKKLKINILISMISCLYLPEQKTELNKAISDAFPKYTLYYHVPPNKLVMAFYIYIFYNTFLS